MTDLARKTVVFFVNASDAGGISVKGRVDSKPNRWKKAVFSNILRLSLEAGLFLLKMMQAKIAVEKFDRKSWIKTR